MRVTDGTVLGVDRVACELSREAAFRRLRERPRGTVLRPIRDTLQEREHLAVGFHA